jgi:hypothetical protein
VAAFGFAFHFLHDWQTAMGSGADDEPLAFPGDLFFEGQGRVAELIAEFLGRGFLAFADFSAVDDNVVLVGAVVDLDSAEGEFTEVHVRPPVPVVQDFFAVTAVKVDQRGSTSWPPQSGQAGF